ncbi:hypothetical protein ABH923_000290 [Leifsonia sp. EB41]|uniref:hypothetical protein n=1 Tax=Leifsonia sp. EB41 TaxID=3156260 RepID=UPI0035136744
MTDPSSRKPKLWLTFGWLVAAFSVAAIAVGTWAVAQGSPVGWINIILGLIFIPQSVLYFRLYRRLRKSDRPHEK